MYRTDIRDLLTFFALVMTGFLGFWTGPVGADVADANASYTEVVTADGSTISQRHESGYITLGGRIYALGGRQVKPVQAYNTVTNKWETYGTLPFEFSHFQPVLWNGLFYAIGVFECCYPDESVLPEIRLYDPFAQSWSVGSRIPADRLRGSTGAVTYNDKIYLIGGNTLGHNGGAVPWFDVYDPATDSWEVLPDAPHARDHFFAAVVGDKLIAAAGRTTVQPNPFVNTVSAVDVYDFSSGQWLTSVPDIPTQRAGAMVVVFGDEVIVIGGESTFSNDAHREVEAYNAVTNTWRSLQPLPTGTHTGVVGIVNGELHVISGSTTVAGAGETTNHVKVVLGPASNSMNDSDADGLTDSDELNQFGTDQNDADSDDDQLSDGAEVLQHNTNPLNPDTDSDQLPDNLEISIGSEPAVADTDNDGLEDGFEYSVSGTDPLLADTDADGILDGDEEMGSTTPGSGSNGNTGSGATGADTETDTPSADSGSGGGPVAPAMLLLLLALVGRQIVFRTGSNSNPGSHRNR